MLTKYASLENAQVLAVYGATTKQRHASLGTLADFHQYKTDDGFLYARIRAISSRVNKNYDGWPAIELAGGQDVFDRHTSSADGFTVTADSSRDYGFSTFLGKPIFVDHHNSDPSRARGVIADAKLHVEDHKTASLDPYYASPDTDSEHLPATWVELLLEVDAKSFPRFAKAIVEGSRNPKKGIDGWSMGCDVERSICSICKNSAVSPEDYCQHIRMKGAYFDVTDPKTGHRTSKLAYENCYRPSFFEISGVFDPADETALSLERIAKSQEETITQDPKTKGLKDLADDQAEDFLEETEHKKERRKSAEAPFVSGAIECPDCAGHGCRSCYGLGYHETAHPGTDGALTPSTDEFNHLMGQGMAGYDPSFLGPVHQGSIRTAENPPPQSEMSHAPEKVDTLREEQICPVCGSSMDEDTCDVCGHEEEPKGFGNPDLTKARDVDLPVEPMNDPRIESPGQEAPPLETPVAPEATNTPSNPTALAHVTKDMAWDVPQKTAARINKVERPLVATERPQTNEPSEKVLVDQTRPVTSRVRTAEDFIAAAGRKHMNHTADAASGAPADAKPDVKTDVIGVGGVDQASNDAASKANAQVDVTGIGGVGVESVSADKEGVKVDQGDEHSKNIEAIHTDTWGPNEGDSLGQHDPVTSEPWPASADGVRAARWSIEGHDDSPWPTDEIGGGSAVQGNQPITENFGERVDVLDHVTSPSNNSGPTKTWTGTEGNGVNKQQDPVTTDSIARGESGMEGAPNWTSSTHIFAAFKLADLEVAMGLIPADRKYERAAELEKESSAVVAASLKYAQRVKTAAVRKAAGAQRLPVMGRPAIEPKEASTSDDESFMFGGL